MSVINTNIMSLVAQQNLKESQNSLTTSMERLSSGLRINSASDDAAGQAIANRFTSQINGLNQAQRNANDGISLAQTTEGSLNQINDNLQTIRTLTVQAANGSNSQSDLESIQDEIDQRLAEINRISDETDFNGTRVLAEGAETLRIQVGANDDQIIEIGLTQIDVTSLNLEGFNVDGSGSTENRDATLTDLDAAGAVQNGSTDQYDIHITHDEAELEDVMAQLTDGDQITVSGAGLASGSTDLTYTYDAANGNFTFENAISSGGVNGETLVTLADDLTPSAGVKEGTFEMTNGSTTEFEINADGTLTIDGQAAYIASGGSTEGALTTNAPSGGGLTQATIHDLLSDDAADSANGVFAFITVDGVRYERADDGKEVTFTDTATSTEVLAAAEAATGGGFSASVSLSDGLSSSTIIFNEDGTLSGGGDPAYLDRNGELTTVQEFTTRYEVNTDNGEVTVLGTTGASGAYNPNNNEFTDTGIELEIGEQARINSDGLITTAETSAGDRTEDPLANLDSAIAQVDALRSELGAVQNRFSDAITNLNTVSTNLSDARSRIEDADYAVEVANMTRAQILQQAGTSVLAQANQIPQNVLSLLG